VTYAGFVAAFEILQRQVGPGALALPQTIEIRPCGAPHTGAAQPGRNKPA
jgi:hypothetical protein